MIKTLNLTANTETSIGNLGGDRCRIQNRTSGTLYVSGNPDIVPHADGVMSIPSGRGDYFSYSMVSDTVYLRSETGGKVEISGEHYYRPFDNAAVTGGKAVGNPVVMDGLQGGVPFSEIVVSGKNLLHINKKYVNPANNDKIQVSLADDGTITISTDGLQEGKKNTTGLDPKPEYNVTLPSGKKFKLHMEWTSGIISQSSLFLAIWWRDSSNKTVKGYYPSVKNTGVGIYDFGTVELTDELKALGATQAMIVPWFWTSDTITNWTFKLQLEEGDSITSYEPPITGREMTLCVNNTEYKITPDNSPYTVPAEIRQQDGVNTITVSDNSNPKITVSYSSENPTLKRIYESIDRISTAIVAMGAEN